MLVGRSFSSARGHVADDHHSVVFKPVPEGQLGTLTALEDENSIPEPDWNSNLVVFEHINDRSGGKKHHDPSK